MDEELKRLADGLAAIQERLDEKDAAENSARAAEAERNTRKTLMDKFGPMFSNDEEIADLVLQALNEKGASVESATEEAVRELILEPLAKTLNKLASAVTSAVKDKVQEVMEGTPAPENSLAAPPSEPITAAPPEGIMPPDLAGEPPPMSPDMGMPPPPGNEAPLPPPGTVSDEGLKNKRVLSDAQLKEIRRLFTESPGVSDEDLLTAIETLAKEEAEPEEEIVPEIPGFEGTGAALEKLSIRKPKEDFDFSSLAGKKPEEDQGSLIADDLAKFGVNKTLASLKV